MERTATIGEALDAFLIDLELSGRSPRTLPSYRSYIKGLGLDTSLTEITVADLGALILSYLRKNETGGAAFACHTALRSFYGWCDKQSYAPNLMLQVPRPKSKPPEHRYLSADEVKRVYEACETDENRLIVRLLLTGVRSRELLAIRFEDIRGDTLHVRSAKKGAPRRVWLDPETVSLIPRGSGIIIRLHPSSLRDRLHAIGARAGLPEITPHWFRRTWATTALLAGMNTNSVQKLGGWSGDRMVLYYARSALQEAALRDSQRMNLTGRLLDADSRPPEAQDGPKRPFY